jgi:hypothetical protein
MKLYKILPDLFDVKRLIGRNNNDSTVQQDKKVQKDNNGKPIVPLRKELVSSNPMLPVLCVIEHSVCHDTVDTARSSGMVLRRMKVPAEA